jgi:hypothetical protein
VYKTQPVIFAYNYGQIGYQDAEILQPGRARPTHMQLEELAQMLSNKHGKRQKLPADLASSLVNGYNTRGNRNGPSYTGYSTGTGTAGTNGTGGTNNKSGNNEGLRRSPRGQESKSNGSSSAGGASGGASGGSGGNNNNNNNHNHHNGHKTTKPKVIDSDEESDDEVFEVMNDRSRKRKRTQDHAQVEAIPQDVTSKSECEEDSAPAKKPRITNIPRSTAVPVQTLGTTEMRPVLVRDTPNGLPFSPMGSSVPLAVPRVSHCLTCLESH